MTPSQLCKAGTESGHQKAFFAWLALNQDRYPLGRNVFAIPNGGKRDPITAARLKAEGAKSGVWDIFVPLPRGRFAGLWLEMKVDKGQLSQDQKDFGEAMRAEFYATSVCWGWRAAVEAFETYMQGNKPWPEYKNLEP